MSINLGLIIFDLTVLFVAVDYLAYKMIKGIKKEGIIKKVNVCGGWMEERNKWRKK